VSLGSGRGELLVTVRTLYPIVLFRTLTRVRISFPISCSLHGSLEVCTLNLPFGVQFLILIIVGKLCLRDLQDFQVLLFEDSLPEGVEGLPALEEDFLADILVPLENLWIESATTVLTFLSWVV
jgi:hypothetical protein